MEDKHSALSDEVLIEIVHCFKDIIVLLIDRVLPRGQRQIEQ